jgi:ABC-2 type transport system permease protein
LATGFFDLQASRAEAYERIVVVGDIHGCSAGFLRVLRLAELLDERGRWQAGSHTYLVVCGDMIDEGSESRGVISLLRSLQQQAKDRVIVLLGNHELLLLRTLLSDSDAVNWETVHSWADVDEDLKALLDDNAVPMLRTATMQQWFQHSLITTGRVDYPNDYLAACARIPQSIAKTAAHLLHRAMAKDGTLSWLLGLPVAAQLGDWGFFHGGPPSDFSGDIAALNREFTAQLMAHQWNHPLLDPAVLEARVQDGSYTGYVSLTAEPNRSEPVFTLVAKRVYPSLISSLELILRPIALQYRLADLRISPEELNQLNAPTLTQVISLAEEQQDMEAVFTSQILAYLMLFLLYMTLIGYGSVLTNGVAAEKGSRVMEMMLVSARPTDLLLGKMIGLGLASFLQYLVWITVGIGVTWLTGAFTSLSIGSLPFELASVPLSTALYFLLFYLLGYFSYAGIFAAAGCLVNRPEESSQTAMPATFVLIVAFFLAYSGLMSPESTVARVSSLLPLVAPMAMFTRIVMTTVPWYEIVLSIVITIGFIQLSIMAGGRIYRAGVLSARRISWMEGLRGSR